MTKYFLFSLCVKITYAYRQLASVQFLMMSETIY